MISKEARPAASFPPRGQPTVTGAKAGFSRIEILIIVTIVGVGVLTLAGLFPLAMQRVHLGDLEPRAARHAQAKLDDLRSSPWEELDEIAAADTVDAVFRRIWQVRDDEPVVGMKQIEVLVAWRDDRGLRTVSRCALVPGPEPPPRR